MNVGEVRLLPYWEEDGHVGTKQDLSSSLSSFSYFYQTIPIKYIFYMFLDTHRYEISLFLCLWIERFDFLTLIQVLMSDFDVMSGHISNIWFSLCRSRRDSVSPPDFNHAHPPSWGQRAAVENVLPFHESAQVLPAGTQMMSRNLQVPVAPHDSAATQDLCSLNPQDGLITLELFKVNEDSFFLSFIPG